MDKWAFLEPWLDVLVPDGDRPPKHEARDRAARRFSIAPRDCIRVSFIVLAIINKNSRAMELVALAIRVDPHVWEEVQVILYDDAVPIDVDRFRPEDLELRFEITALTTLPSGPRDVTRSAAAFAAAKREIFALDERGRLCDFQIPLTFVLDAPTDEVVVRAVDMFKRLLKTGNVALPSAADPSARYVLRDVKLESSWETDREYLREDRRGPAAYRRLRGLQDLGVPITTFVGHVRGNVPDFLDWMAVDRPVSVTLLIETNADFACVSQACGRLGARLEALTLGFWVHDLDARLAASTLLQISKVCPSLRYLEFLDGLPCDVWDELAERSKAAAMVASPIRAFTMPLFDGPVTPYLVITRLAVWLPSLHSLTLTRGRQEDQAVLGNADLVLILASFPLLVALHVEPIRLSTWSYLFDAYATRQCRIRTLVMETTGLSCAPLLNALAGPSARIARTLTELEIRRTRLRDNWEVLMAAETMQANNKVLECLRLPIRYTDPKESIVLRERVARFNRQRLGMRRNLAFLSVVKQSPLLSSIGSDAVALILEMARGPRLRLVNLRK